MTRIIAGEWRGHQLPRLTGGSVRPTTDRARTILFDTLWNVQDLAVLDLYSGSGALGFEALSRGAATLVSIDQDRNYIHLQKEWIKKHPKPFSGYVGRVEQVLGNLTETFDLILADPPYAEELSLEVQFLIEKHTRAGAIFVYERSRRATTALESEYFRLEKEKVVAETKIQIYKAVSV